MGKCLNLLVGSILSISIVGCVSINSENFEDRMSAVDKLSTQQEYAEALENAKYQDVQCELVKHITEQGVLQKVVIANRYGDEVKCLALSRISDRKLLRDVSISGDEKLALVAVNGLKDKNDLVKVACECKVADVALSCIRRVDDQQLLKSVVLERRAAKYVRRNALSKISDAFVIGQIALAADEEWILSSVVPQINDEVIAKKLIVRPTVSDVLKLLLIDCIVDQQFLLGYARNMSVAENVRRKALFKVTQVDLLEVLLNIRPPVEAWMVNYALKGNIPEATLVSVSVENSFNKESRVVAFGKIKTESSVVRVFDGAKDDLAIRLALGRLQPQYCKSDKGQNRLVEIFRIASDTSLLREIILKLDKGHLEDFYGKEDQEKIARLVSAHPDDRAMEVARNALFDDDIILKLALGAFDGDEKVASFALDLILSSEILQSVVMGAKSSKIKCQALSRIKDEKLVADLCSKTDNRAVKIAAIARLTKQSESALEKLSGESDAIVKRLAVERMKQIGGDRLQEFERKLEEEQKAILAKEKLKKEQQEAARKREHEDYIRCVFLTVGSAQILIIRKFLELKNKANINSPNFFVAGIVDRINGRSLKLNVLSNDGEVPVLVKMSRNCKVDLKADDAILISGYDDESSFDNIKLRCGEVLAHGVEAILSHESVE